MGKTMGVVLGVLGLLVFVAAIVLASFVSTYNGAVNHEAGIKAQYEANQANYDSMWKKVKETAQVPDMYAGDLQKLYKGVVEGRKGSDKELVRVIKEANPQMDASLYRQIQQVIEAGRNSFEADQKMLVDKIRAYEVQRVSFPSNVMLGLFGFPRIDLAKYAVVTSDETSSAFSTKKAPALQIRINSDEKK